MAIHPAIKSLRSDPAPQRQAQRALETVREHWLSAGGGHLREELAAFSNGARMADCSVLDAVLSGRDITTVRSMMQELTHSLAEHPLGHIPLRHGLSNGVGLLQLLECGRASLSIVLNEPTGKRPRAQSISFVDAERYELILAGEARARLVERSGRAGEAPAARSIELRPGSKLVFEGKWQSKVIDEVTRPLVTLRLTRSAREPQPSCEIRIADGAILHRASGDPAQSRNEMAMALLTAMGRNDAAPQIERMTGQGWPEARWHALRHLLVLDPVCGWNRLCRIAATKPDPLSAHARQLRNQLAASHPQLAAGDRLPCPA